MIFKRRKRKGDSRKISRKIPLTRSPGRAEYIADVDLIGSRDALVSLVENTWCDVCWRFERLRKTLAAGPLPDLDTAGDLRLALRSWDQEFYRLRCAPVKLLLNGNALNSSFTTIQLRAMSRELEQIGHAKVEKSAALQEYRNLHQLATAALPNTFKRYEADAIQRRLQKLSTLIHHADAEYQSIVEAEPRLLENYTNACASFAQQQLIEFLRKPRNELTPLRVANAIAGLPFIGWRQSAERCAFYECQPANGFQYRTLMFIVKAVESRAWQTDLVKAVGKKVYAKNSPDRPVVSALRDNWSSLKGAIEIVLSTETEEGAAPRPFRIAAEYFRRVQSPSQTDMIVDKIDRTLDKILVTE